MARKPQQFSSLSISMVSHMIFSDIHPDGNYWDSQLEPRVFSKASKACTMGNHTVFFEATVFFSKQHTESMKHPDTSCMEDARERHMSLKHKYEICPMAVVCSQIKRHPLPKQSPECFPLIVVCLTFDIITFNITDNIKYHRNQFQSSNCLPFLACWIILSIFNIYIYSIIYIYMNHHSLDISLISTTNPSSCLKTPQFSPSSTPLGGVDLTHQCTSKHLRLIFLLLMVQKSGHVHHLGCIKTCK